MGGIFFCLHINWPTVKGGGGGELIRVIVYGHTNTGMSSTFASEKQLQNKNESLFENPR